LYTTLVTTTELKGDLTIAHPSAKHESNVCLLFTVIVWPSMRVVSIEQNILVFSYVLITGFLVQRVAEDFLPLMLDDHVQDFHWCLKIVKRDCSKISTSSLQSESFALPRDAWFLSKQAGLVVDYF
jgi:hypothetical protein